jgi:hypothetical protein
MLFRMRFGRGMLRNDQQMLATHQNRKRLSPLTSWPFALVRGLRVTSLTTKSSAESASSASAPHLSGPRSFAVRVVDIEIGGVRKVKGGASHAAAPVRFTSHWTGQS